MSELNPSGWLPNMLGPVKLEASGEEMTSRGTLNFDGATAIDDPDNDRMTIAWGGDASSIGGVDVTGPGDVPVDTATFGTEGDVKSFVFRGAGDSDNPVTVDLYTLPDHTAADICITVLWKHAANASAYRRDHRFTIVKDGVTVTTIEQDDKDAVFNAAGIFDDATDHSTAAMVGNIVRWTGVGVADEVTSYSITVQVQETKDA